MATAAWDTYRWQTEYRQNNTTADTYTGGKLNIGTQPIDSGTPIKVVF